jgi:Ca-activated chloride channel family protein
LPVDSHGPVARGVQSACFPEVPVAPAVLLSLLLAAPQTQTSPQPPSFSAGLDMVNVTVTVRDAHGKLVTDLSAEDFIVKEDGRPQAIEVFARAHEPGQDEVLTLDLGMLLDTSTSMLEQLKLSQEAATRFLESVPRARELITIFFDHEIRVSKYDSENQQGLFDRIHSAKGGGDTALYDAMAVYLSRVEGSAGRKVVVLFTDGEDSRSELTLPEIMALLRSSRVTVYPICFQSFAPGTSRAVKSRAVLQQFADLSGGALFNPSASRDLGAIYQKILDELGGQYVLGYVSDNQKADGKLRRLVVELPNHKPLKVRHRTGYMGKAKEKDREPVSP